VKRSAGIALVRQTDRGLEVLLGHMGGPYWARKDAGAWTIPKGEVEPGEDPLAVAHREFEEELGVPVPAGTVTDLGEIRQAGGKTVRAWAVEGDLDAAAIVSNTFELEWPPHSGRMETFPEIDRAAWFDLERARAVIITGQRPLLDRLPT
jgi:predicted NUDIX family NTP pyrophosphohydrolase